MAKTKRPAADCSRGRARKSVHQEHLPHTPITPATQGHRAFALIFANGLVELVSSRHEIMEVAHA